MVKDKILFEFEFSSPESVMLVGMICWSVIFCGLLTKKSVTRNAFDYAKTLIETIEDLDGITFDQIIDAIHEVQTNMGITGTTAKEAATTIEGSINSAKAALDNLLVGIADENQDVSELTKQLVESVETAASNVLPRILEIFKGIGEAAQDIGPVIAEKLPGVVTEVVPAFFSAGQSMMKAIGTALNDIQINWC